MKILLIEDDAGLVELITPNLEELEFSVMSAASGAEALAHLKKQTPDLMLLDYSLPDINGKELIETIIQQHTSPPPFIITTGQGDERIAVDMMKLGAMDYLVKDILFLEKLPDVVKRVVKEIESEGKLRQAEETLKESEKKYQMLFNTLPIGLALCKTNGDLVDVNPAYAKIIGQSVEETLKLSYWELTPQKYEEQEKEQMESLERIKRYGPYEKEYIHKDGQLVPVRLIGQQIKQNGEKLIWSSVEDITEQKKLERQFEDSQKMESIGILAGGIAHDFNNIMAIILGNTELALGDVPKWNSAHSSLEEIKTASLRATNIVKQLLSFSRKTDQELQPIQIALVIKDALKFLRSTIPTTINIHRDIPTTDETILADPTQINQIIMNLCINASHAMEQTGGDLTVTVAKVVLDDNSAKDYPDLRSGDHVKIIVSDTGPGIDPKIIDQIFDPYFTTKEVGKGSGMGLAVVHGIVKNHNGAIIVESSSGKGTKFSIFFPLATEKPMVEAQTNKDIPRGNETILFVDDEISIVKMVKRMFERLGYKVETATTPQDALELFRSNPDHFDLVITDMTMPQMTGVKLSEKLMALRKDIPIIVCSGYSNLVDDEKAKELGLAAYIMKPINMLETAQTIRKVLDKK
jgi:PAS domain S-box-containing protein